MENISFLDFLCQNICHTEQDPYLTLCVADYAKILVAYNIGVLSTDQLADKRVAIIRTIRSREMGEMLYENYINANVIQ
ncbi:hypothetical protein BN938_1471 [Mucinivorans hirudinis]|uniref:Uncharacterized protein n=1 Tax=Mucinivorans hirudinis TaxID=1433126 RepID=A0A060RCL1_9BACT|nr:hypothetical protein BN938_1471 [Mucinivorans hirudinis]